MSFTFLPNGHVQVAVLKKGTGDRFFSSSKWQKRFLDIDPETGRLEYSDKAGGPAKGDFMVRHSILTLPPPTIEGTTYFVSNISQHTFAFLWCLALWLVCYLLLLCGGLIGFASGCRR